MRSKISKILFVSLVVLFISIVVGFASSAASDKPGAMLWAENCGRCHNLRPPSSLTDEQWDVAVLHMRTRANLTEEEAKKIVEFLKAGN
ncbi:hypothetical protein BMS3Abin03_01293 [bacterium BMS3Abin03]|nr:hypothetical protein BMS3Abin03_01293 [bacterium BMS3Abin03]